MYFALCCAMASRFIFSYVDAMAYKRCEGDEFNRGGTHHEDYETFSHHVAGLSTQRTDEARESRGANRTCASNESLLHRSGRLAGAVALALAHNCTYGDESCGTADAVQRRANIERKASVSGKMQRLPYPARVEYHARANAEAYEQARV